MTNADAVHDRRRQTTGCCRKPGRSVSATIVAFGLWAATLVAVQAAEVAPKEPTPLRLWSVSFSPDGKFLAAGAGTWDTPGRLTLWDVVARRPKWVRDEKLGIANLTYSPDGETIATAGYDHIGRLIDAETGEERVKLEGHAAGVNSVSFSPDGKRLATAGLDKLVKIWDVETGTELASLTGHEDLAISVAFAPDGRHVASAGRDRKALLWDIETQQIVHAFEGHGYWIQQVVFSPDGKWLATASYDHTARVWDADTGRLLSTLAGAQGTVPSVAFVPNSMELATVSEDKKVRFYEVILPGQASKAPAATADAVKRLDDDVFEVREAAERELAKLGFSATEELAAGATESKPREMRIRCRRLLARLQFPSVKQQITAHQSPLQHLVFSPDGNLMATAGRDGTIKLWDALSAKELAQLVDRGVP